MKNKFITVFFIFFVLKSFAFSKEFKFETNKIEVTNEGRFINAENGKATSSDGNLEIKANKFRYDKDNNILDISGNGIITMKSENIELRFEKASVNQNEQTITTNGKVKILDKKKNLEIISESVFYDQRNNNISSEFETKIQDRNKNKYLVNKFYYEINKDVLKVENLSFKDKQNNKLNSSLAFINTKTNRIFGKDVNINLSNENFGNNNEPRLKGNSIINDEKYLELNKGVFTTCKKRDGCPPWQLSSEKIQHDKEKKIINYENAVLRVYDFPVIYFPKFYHPDPTVKRQSGFLVPSFNSSLNSSNYLNIPYFHVVSENKDFTFSPRLYSNKDFLFQTEFRQANLNSNHIADFSFFRETSGSIKNHFFYNFSKVLNIENFESNKLDIKMQKTSNDNFLKNKKIESTIIDDLNILENSINLNLYSNNISYNFNATAYEDNNKDNTDKYEYIFPKIDIAKKLQNKTSLNGDFLFNSENLVRNYNTNIFEISNINNLLFTSHPKITKKGFFNNYEFMIKNANTDGKNSKSFKEKENVYLSGLLQLNSSMPMIKENTNYDNIFKPKLSLKIAPSHTRNYQDDEITINLNNIFSLDRISKNDTVEGGVSLAYGADYLFLDKDSENEILSFKIANNLRFNENDDLTNSFQIGEKTSNFFTETKYTPNETFNIKYDNALRNSISEIGNENLQVNFNFNNFKTSFQYLNENNTNKDKTFLQNTTSFNFDNSNSLIFSTREDKKTNLTEFYRLIYQYKNDCLAASIEYNKDYYNDRDIKTGESVLFKLSIIPLGETNSPFIK
tara:strand:- start:162 stop:2543 length:2382 start_codon:yes stop_codon:yes gene_type:complete